MIKPSLSIRNRLMVARLPAMPQILVKLIELCQRDEAGMDQVAKLIAHDAGMTAKILSIANSSAYRHNGIKLGLVQSLNTLGLEMIKTLVINESVFQTFNSFSHSNSADLRGFWVHALKAAVISRELAKKMSYPHSEEAYLAGLLHDAGRLALLSAAPQDYSPIFGARDDEQLCAVEASSMGITHAEAGAWLAEQWNLDSFLTDSVLYHHEPIARLKSAHPLIRILCLAHLLCSYKGDTPALEEAAISCALDQTDLDAILTGVNAYTRTAATYFGIDLTDAEQVPPAAEYVPVATSRNPAEERLADEVRNMALVSASAKSFSGMRSGKELLEGISRAARVMFNLEDVIVLLQNADTRTLVGFPIGEHQQRLSEFSIPLDDGGIIAESVQNKRVSFAGRDDKSLGIIDRQLLRAMNCESMVYMPLIAGQSCLGVLAGGLSLLQCTELWGQEQFLKAFAAQAASSLESSTAIQSEIQTAVTRINDEHRIASRRVIHEVSNPLSIIKNYLGVLDDKLARQEPVHEELSILNEEIDRVSRIVGGLTESQSTPRVETTELNDVLKDVVRLFSISRFLPANVTISVRTTEQPDVMSASSDQIKQILLNLIKNAVEALPMGGDIEVRNKGRVVRDGNSYIELHIRDNGAGIPADVLANLFAPVHSSKGGENRGLGLNIVQSLVKRLNGFITCHSGKSGTTFEVLLPAHDATTQQGRRTKTSLENEVNR